MRIELGFVAHRVALACYGLRSRHLEPIAELAPITASSIPAFPSDHLDR
jgi:hypothetical protein